MSWLEASRELGQSLLDLLQAEVAALGSDLGSSAQKIAKAAGLFAIAMFLIFWSIGILAYLAIVLLTGPLPAWGAIAVVLTVFLLGALIFGWMGKSRVSRLESPNATLSRRFEEHRQWWESTIGGQSSARSDIDFKGRGDEENL